MPVIFSDRGFRFHFYSSEGDPREPMHVHVAKRGEGDAKFWLYPEVAMADNRGLDARTLRWLTEQISIRRPEIVSAWHEHFGTPDER
ncbi:MAG: DUF4160 domain-containing protein [Sphingomonas sp.]|nr:MAG: DUF4160 domain-containing protein [Sphingomonas sp.]